MSTRPLDPNRSTRAEFTANFLALPSPPANASPKWTRLTNSLAALIKALGEHEGMTRNNQQTYMTPAADKNAQYFAWDFVGRKISYAVSADPTLQRRSPEWTDACSRSTMIASLLLDEKPGFLNQLVEQTYPGLNPGGQPVMSAEIISAAEELKAAAAEEIVAAR